MLCPYCQTENRDDREECYYCQKDLSMLRLIVNKAKHHYNQGLEYAERNRPDEALRELENAIDLDSSLANAHVVMGTIYAQRDDFDKAAECWKRALSLDHRFEKAHGYLSKMPGVQRQLPVLRQLRIVAGVLAALLVIALVGMFALSGSSPDEEISGKAVKVVTQAESPEAAAKSLSLLANNDIYPQSSRDLIANFAGKLKMKAKTVAADSLTTAPAAGKLSPAAAVFAQVSKLLDEGKALEAGNLLAALPSDRLSLSERKTADALTAQARLTAYAELENQAEAYHSRKLDFESFQTAAQAFQAAFDSGPEAASAAELIEKTQDDHAAQADKVTEEQAREMWEWFSSRDGRFQEGRISSEDAKRAIEIHQSLLASLPTDLTYAAGPIYFYTGVAYFKLARKEEARAYFDKVREEYGRSYVVKSLKIFSELFSDALNQSATPEPEKILVAPVMD